MLLRKQTQRLKGGLEFLLTAAGQSPKSFIARSRDRSEDIVFP